MAISKADVQTEQAIEPNVAARAAADAMLAGFCDAIDTAIREHLAAGHAVYYLDQNDHTVMIKELPNGRRFQVARDETGVQYIVRELSPVHERG